MFDPKNPLPRRTVAVLMGTGVGQASPTRLVVAAIAGAAGALAGLALQSWGIGIPSLCVAAFASWGLAAKAEQALDLAHDPAPVHRRLLGVARVVAATVGVVSAIFLLGFLIGLAFGWNPAVEILDGP